jgi:cyclic beta-1,2-glucan synthetase
MDITRWRDDALRDAHGSFFYLRRARAAAAAGVADPASRARPAGALPQLPRRPRLLRRRWPDLLQPRTTVWVSPEDDIEFRQVELRNPATQRAWRSS